MKAQQAVRRFAFTSLAMAAAVAAAAPSLPGRNLLRNPSFEAAAGGEDGGPAHWEIGTIYGTGPNVHEWSREGHTGSRSVRLHSMHVTEFVQQRVQVTGKGPFTARIHARGAGRFMVVISAFVPAVAGKPERRQLLNRMFGTTDRWLPYTVRGAVPEGVEELCVMLGTPRHQCNVWFDDASLTRSAVQEKTPEAEAPASHPRGRVDSFDIASFCEVRSDPFARGGIRTVTDGDLLTSLVPEVGPGRGARIAFILPRKATLRGLDLVQSGASSYLIDADTNGDGEYDRTLVRIEDGARQRSWIKHALEPMPVHAVRLVGLVRNGRWGGWDRGAFPSCAEVRLWVAAGPWVDSLPVTVPPSVPGAPVRIVPVNQPPRAFPPAESSMAAPVTDHTSLGVCISPWMAGWHATRAPAFKATRCEAFAAELRRLRVDHVILIPGGSGGAVPWPSAVVRGTESDFCQRLTACLGAHEIRTYFLGGHDPKPTHPESPWPTWFGQLLAESVANGCAGVSVCADEFPQCGGKPDPGVYAAALKRELGLDAPPPVRADTEAYRRFMLFHYRQVAAFHRQAAERALEQNAGTVLLSNWRIDPIALNSTYGCLAYDILAGETTPHYMGTDPYYSDPSRRPFLARCVKLLAAANRPRGALAILKAGRWGRWDTLEEWRNIVTGGSAVAAAMHGAGAVNIYRHNYLRLNANTHWIREAFEIIGFLDRHGLRASREPRDIAVLHSRASEDFWQHRCHLTDGDDPGRDGVRGYITQKAVEELLLSHSIPATYYYLEREQDFEEELREYPVILLPFPYCVSDRAFRAIAAARAAGSHVVVCDRLGETNELGTPRGEPAFAAWSMMQKAPRFSFVPDVLGRFWRPEAQEDFLRVIRQALGGRATLRVEAGGKNVEGIVRCAPDGKLLASFINWEDEPRGADVSLRLPRGEYSVVVVDKYGHRPGGVREQATAGPEGTRDGAFPWGAVEGGRTAVRTRVTAADLADFALQLPRQFIRVLVIEPLAGVGEP